MKDFANASFALEMIEAMEQAVQDAVATLPDPVRSMRIQSMAESILRNAQQARPQNVADAGAGRAAPVLPVGERPLVFPQVEQIALEPEE